MGVGVMGVGRVSRRRMEERVPAEEIEWRARLVWEA